MIVAVFGKLISYSLLLTIQCREAELMNRMAIKRSLVAFIYRVMPVDPHRPVIMRDRKDKDGRA